MVWKLRLRFRLCNSEDTATTDGHYSSNFQLAQTILPRIKRSYADKGRVLMVLLPWPNAHIGCLVLPTSNQKDCGELLIAVFIRRLANVYF